MGGENGYKFEKLIQFTKKKLTFKKKERIFCVQIEKKNLVYILLLNLITRKSELYLTYINKIECNF